VYITSSKYIRRVPHEFQLLGYISQPLPPKVEDQLCSNTPLVRLKQRTLGRQFREMIRNITSRDPNKQVLMMLTMSFFTAARGDPHLQMKQCLDAGRA
jgi:hypothetical protein